MEFGLFMVTQFDLDRNLRGIGATLVDQTRRANAAGFNFIGVGEHHFTSDHQYLMNETCLAHVAHHVGDMRLVASLILLPYHNPARIAELGATLDILTEGAFTLGVGLGYRQQEYDVFGVDREDAVSRYIEGLEIVKRLWTEDHVTFDGEHFQLNDVAIRPQPIQTSRPPIWTGASNASSVRRGARETDGFLGAHVPFDIARRQIDDFREERRQHNLDEGTVGLLREAFVAESTEIAEAKVREPLVEKYQSYTRWGQDDVIEGDNFDSPWDRLKEERFLVGNPEAVRNDIDRYRSEMDLDYLFVRMQYPGMPIAAVNSSIELFGEEVIPYYK